MEAKKRFVYDQAITHSTTFHADDVFGSALCNLIIPGIRIVRTLEPEKVATVDSIVFDIGWDKGFPEYDHHQKEGKALRSIEDGTYKDKDGNDCCIPYCGFGLLWRDFGHLLCPEYSAWKKVDMALVLPIDKADNGIAVNPLSASIKAMNPQWNEDKEENEAFNEALAVATVLLKAQIDSANAAVDAKDYVIANYTGGDVLALDRYLPWTDTVIADERLKDVMFVVYPSNRGGWNVQNVPMGNGSLKKRMLFPEEWLGHKDPDRGIHFAHTSNFLIGCDTKEQAIRVAEEAVEAGKQYATVAYSV